MVPVEIVERIFLFINKTDIASFSKVSKQFHQIANDPTLLTRRIINQYFKHNTFDEIIPDRLNISFDNDTEFQEVLIRNTCRLPNLQWSLMYRAILNNTTSFAINIAKLGSLDINDTSTENPWLIHAVKRNNPILVSEFLKLGAIPDLKGEWDATALEYACIKKNISDTIIEELLNYGAEIDEFVVTNATYHTLGFMNNKRKFITRDFITRYIASIEEYASTSEYCDHDYHNFYGTKKYRIEQMRIILGELEFRYEMY